MKRLILTLLLATACGPVAAELRIFACEPEWAALAEAVGDSLRNGSSPCEQRAIEPSRAQPALHATIHASSCDGRHARQSRAQ